MLKGAVIAGVIVVAVAAGCSSGDGGNAGPSPLETFTPSPASTVVLEPPAPTAPAAATAQAAVEAHLQAEIAGDVERSFATLAEADRARLVDAAGWRAARTRRPRVTGYALQPPDSEGNIVTGVDLEPAVDPVLGVVPSRAVITWRTVAEDGGWRVSIEGSTLVPRFPDGAAAAPAALDWVEQRQACIADPSAGALLLQPDLASQLCQQPGTFRISSTGDLTALADPSGILDAYGPDASTWARVVRLTGPATLDVVTAPLGSAWVVIGLTAG
jgi:hypothetical protein